MDSITEQIETFIDYKRGLGIGFQSPANCLRQFARFAESVDHTGPVDMELACRWARSGAGHTKGYECARYEQVRRFSDFCRAFDESLPQLQPGLLGKMGNRVEPYIYSDEDIGLLMYAAGTLNDVHPLRPLAHQFLIGLLRATGMRPSEALNLTNEDIDEEKQTILVKDSKGKSRLLPVTGTTLDAIAAYRDKRDQKRPHFKSRNLLISTDGVPLSLCCADDAFKEYRHVLLRRGEVWKRRPPRLYDVRHSFCCWTIIRWYEEGRDVASLIPALSNYMGHEHIADTYWYLSNVPRLLSIACEAFRDIAVREVFSDE
jgi:integrase